MGPAGTLLLTQIVLKLSMSCLRIGDYYTPTLFPVQELYSLFSQENMLILFPFEISVKFRISYVEIFGMCNLDGIEAIWDFGLGIRAASLLFVPEKRSHTTVSVSHHTNGFCEKFYLNLGKIRILLV
jgi:hypothetical protein